jgi:hypothetical protein
MNRQVKSEIHKRLEATKQELEKLGGKRETAAEQRHYLLDLSMVFQQNVSSALSADYVGSDFLDEFSTLRLATQVVTRNELFATTLEQYGHSHTFDRAPSTISPRPRRHVGLQTEELDTEDGNKSGKALSSSVRIRSQECIPDLEEFTIGDEETTIPSSENILNWLTGVYKESRGFELGTFNNSLLATTMKTQSSKWETIAMGYVKDVIAMAHEFILKLLESVCSDLRVREGLTSVLMDDLRTKYQRALDSAKFLLYVERHGTPATLNHYFNENLEKR